MSRAASQQRTPRFSSALHTVKAGSRSFEEWLMNTTEEPDPLAGASPAKGWAAVSEAIKPLSLPDAGGSLNGFGSPGLTGPINKECGKATMKMAAPYSHHRKKSRPLCFATNAGINPKSVETINNAPQPQLRWTFPRNPKTKAGTNAKPIKAATTRKLTIELR